ncbi:unnamed protein product [Moneuplotes crassus]|uniref:Uncharacterized protein n=1 Tax=Euplotes crassus TaxID=5936 RepID=A0AAD1UDP5_EUPCR|nr:unnamed protein product [Moneuplotes crassus]
MSQNKNSKEQDSNLPDEISEKEEDKHQAEGQEENKPENVENEGEGEHLRVVSRAASSISNEGGDTGAPALQRTVFGHTRIGSSGNVSNSESMRPTGEHSAKDPPLSIPLTDNEPESSFNFCKDKNLPSLVKIKNEPKKDSSSAQNASPKKKLSQPSQDIQLKGIKNDSDNKQDQNIKVAMQATKKQEASSDHQESSNDAHNSEEVKDNKSQGSHKKIEESKSNKSNEGLSKYSAEAGSEKYNQQKIIAGPNHDENCGDINLFSDDKPDTNSINSFNPLANSFGNSISDAREEPNSFNLLGNLYSIPPERINVNPDLYDPNALLARSDLGQEFEGNLNRKLRKISDTPENEPSDSNKQTPRKRRKLREESRSDSKDPKNDPKNDSKNE